MEFNEILPLIMSEVEKHPEITEAEGYVSRNSTTMVRIETLRYGRKKFGPEAQQLKTIETSGIGVRIVVGKSMGTATTSYFTVGAIKLAIYSALKNAKRMEADPNYKHLVKDVGKQKGKLPYDKKIYKGAVEDDLIKAAEAATSVVDQNNLDLAGKIMTVSQEFSVANTNGVEVDNDIDTFIVAQLTGEKLKGADIVSSGVGWHSARLAKDLDAEKAAVDALEPARITPKLKKVDEGDYSVILSPYAVSDIIDNMMASAFTLGSIYMGMSWLPVERKKLFNEKDALFPKMDEMVASELITFRDDPLIKDGMSSKNYDDEGVPTSKHTLIEKGQWKDVLADSYYSFLYELGKPGNGFRTDLVPGRCAGALPSDSGTNMILEPGDMSFDELVEVAEGPTLVLPRTWYTYPTRYGAPTFSSSNRSTSFLVDKGELVPVAPNAFKLIGDIRTILNEVMGIGKEVQGATTWAASQSTIAPHLATKGIRVEKSHF